MEIFTEICCTYQEYSYRRKSSQCLEKTHRILDKTTLQKYYVKICITLYGNLQSTKHCIKQNYDKVFSTISVCMEVLFFRGSNKNMSCCFFPHCQEFTHSMLSTTQQTTPQGSTLSSSTIIPIITQKNVSLQFIYYCWNARLLLHIPPSNKHGSCVTSQLCSAWTSSEA